MYTIAEMREENRAAGWHFFENPAIKFFKSKFHKVCGQNEHFVYFTTSEQFNAETTRLYSVRRFCRKTKRVKTIGGYQCCKTLTAANAAAMQLALKEVII